jgi:hypothetical protein
MTTSAMAVCPECGAPQLPGAECRTCFDALLAFEAERAEVFAAVHHLTVATYFLQHPTGYSAEARASWAALLDDALAGRVRVGDLRRRQGRQFAGARRVREPGAPMPADWPRRWPMTVRDVFDPREPLPAPAAYIARAKEWASATSATLAARAAMPGEDAR